MNKEFGARLAIPQHQSVMSDAPEINGAHEMHRLTRSGIFKADISIFEDVEAAEEYLSKSAGARKLFGHLKALRVPIVVNYGKDSDRQVGWGENSRIDWDNKAFLEAHDGERFHAPGSCSINSAALVFLHEAYHADWAISNQIGQFMLMSLPHPLYDNLEEARVIRLTNEAAIELHEAIRGSHRGRLHAARDYLDTNSLLCRDRPRVVTDQPGSQDILESITSNSLTVSAKTRKNLYSLIPQFDSPQSELLVKAADKILDSHDQIGQQLAQMNVDRSLSYITENLGRIYDEQINLAIEVAEKFQNIAPE